MITTIGDANVVLRAVVEEWQKLFSFLASGHFRKLKFPTEKNRYNPLPCDPLFFNY